MHELHIRWLRRLNKDVAKLSVAEFKVHYNYSAHYVDLAPKLKH